MSTRSVLRRRTVLMLLGGGLAILAGCLSAVGPIDGGNLGVTAGGAQDIAEARSRIQAGDIPDPDSIQVEGFLSEHDIPLTPPENAPELYASVGMAWRQGFGLAASGADIFVRLGTTVDVSEFTRRPLNLVLVIDRSGSMETAASAADNRSKLEAVNQALHSLFGRLDGSDTVSVVSFNQRVRVDLEATSADQTDRIGRAIDSLRAGGNTDLYAALRTGFEKAAQAAADTRDSRVIVFTDALPTAGEEGAEAFVDLVGAYAEQNVGLTLMSVGYSSGTDLINRMAQQRLANAFFLSDADRIASIFEEEFDYFVTPAVFDLNLQISIPDGVGIRDVYGVPDYVPGARGAQVTIPTLFFSAREGGGIIVVRLTFAQPPDFATEVEIGSVALEYTLRDGRHREMASTLTLPAGLAADGEPPYYSDTAVQRAAILLDAALVLREAVDAAYESSGWEAAEVIDDYLAWFDQATLGLSDRTDPTSRGLSDERDLLEELAGVLRGNARWRGYGWR